MIKAFIISSLIMILVFSSGVFISSNLKKRTELMTDAVLSLPEERLDVKAEDIVKIRAEFDNLKTLYILTIKKDYILNAELCFENLAVCAFTGTKSEYLYAKKSFLCAIDTISSLLSFSPVAIF